jgi:hypothetical protein
MARDTHFPVLAFVLLKSESLRVMVAQLAAFRALAKITRSRDLSFAELPYG